jgi:poly(3-hydroxybutyrate) depolymerase
MKRRFSLTYQKHSLKKNQTLEEHMQPRRTISLIVFLFFFLCLPLFSQIQKLDEKNLEETMRNPWKPDDSIFLQDWLVLGSFACKSPDEIDIDFLKEQNGEVNVQPAEGQVVNISGTNYKWTRVQCKDIVDLQKFFQGGRNEDAVAYAFATINRKEAGKMTFMLGSDDGVKVWVNGIMLHRVLTQRALLIDEDRIVANLNAGENHILLKIQQSKGGWGFAVRMLVNPNQFNLITGSITFSLSKPNIQENTITVSSDGNLDQSLLRQSVQMDVYGAGGKNVAKETFYCSEPVVLNYKTWPDGAYEFRFLYKDIRSLKTYTYNLWYKGDAFAAARELVKNAPSKEIRTPEGCYHRMLADKILNRLENNLDNQDSSKLPALYPSLMEFAEIKAKSQIRANGCLRLTYIDDIDNTPQFCRSYLPLNYDRTKKYPLVVYLHGYNQDNPEYYNWWSTDKRHESMCDKYDVILIEPHGRGNTQYLGIGDRDVMKCIEMAKQKFNIDEDRVYLMGGSMGGFGTWNVATRHPELFAAMAPIFGGGDYHVYNSKESLEKMNSWEIYLLDKSSSTAQLEVLANMPILVTHGDKDPAVDVNLSRYLVRMLQRWNYNVRYKEVPGMGHSEVGVWDDIIQWMLQYKRNSAPRLVRVRAADLKNASAYWVTINQKKNPYEFMLADVEALEGNIIRVDSKNALELTLTPPKPLVDDKQPVKVVWNGKVVPIDISKSKTIVLREDGYTPSTGSKTPLLSGPILDIQNTPYMVVIGTISKDTLMDKMIKLKSSFVIGDWKISQKYEPRVKKDIDVTDEDMKMYSLILFGGAEDNSITKKISEKIPFKVMNDEIRVDDKTFKVKDAILCTAYPNPFNRERYIGIIAATSGTGMSFFDIRRREQFQFDFIIADAKIPLYSIGAKDNKILIASGFFNHNWKIDESYLQTGDEKLRAQCANVSMNSDLTTIITSSSKPSAELLAKYAGTYQIINGPEVIVTLANGVLKIAQTAQKEFAIVMHPLAENEFYVKEINLSVSFKKDLATQDYTLVIHQSGQDAESKKVK